MLFCTRHPIKIEKKSKCYFSPDILDFQELSVHLKL